MLGFALRASCANVPQPNLRIYESTNPYFCRLGGAILHPLNMLGGAALNPTYQSIFLSVGWSDTSPLEYVGWSGAQPNRPIHIFVGWVERYFTP